MTFPPGRRWPAVAKQRRTAIESCAAAGELCTVIVQRDASGLVLSFLGSLRTMAAPSPGELAELIQALRTAAGAP